ncbi:RNA-directed DNA polymerase (reverse transcriptase) protein [Sphingobium sp. PAMC28499]|nr:RNA-directed DNA polymerase (reverse transcriptase) protein [Sphingobium sp. PAMC28499]
MATVQELHFSESSLKALFSSRIIKSRAVGLDGTRLEAFTSRLDEECALIERKVLCGTYTFTRYREKLILKGATRLPRRISIPTVRDRLALRAICNLLAEAVPGARSAPPHSYIKAIASLIKGTSEPLSFLRVDVRDFFPSIQHNILLSKLKDLGVESLILTQIQKAIENQTGSAPDYVVSGVGVPQGLSISNLLASVYMQEFDAEAAKRSVYHRYVDDILVVAPSHEITARFKEIHAGLLELRLDPHPMGRSGKTEIKRISEGIDYLGYHLTPRKISVRTSSYHRMFKNLSKVFTQYKYKKNLQQFLFKLNLRITGCVVDGKRKGWLLFFSQTDDLSQLRYLDEFVATQCRRVGINPKASDIARFVKAYHEIRFKGVVNGYIPNFDNFTLEQKYALINNLTGVPFEELDSRSVEVTQADFRNLVAKEVADLEQDVLTAIS